MTSQSPRYALLASFTDCSDGWESFQTSGQSIDELKALLIGVESADAWFLVATNGKVYCNWWQIVDLRTCKIIESGNNCDLPNKHERVYDASDRLNVDCTWFKENVHNDIEPKVFIDGYWWYSVDALRKWKRDIDARRDKALDELTALDQELGLTEIFD